MYHNIHTDFILTPISEILENGINASQSIEDGIATFPLQNYILSALFIQMTGAQEQKLKCIAWEMATHDYEFRRELLSDKNKEYSTYKDKQRLYKALLELRKNSTKEKSAEADRKKGIRLLEDNYSKKDVEKVHKGVISLFRHTHFRSWLERDFLGFQKEEPTVSSDEYTRIVYNHRNRLAHNTLSYQRDLPKLDTLASEDYDEQNYFYRFFYLILIDTIFTELYQEYIQYMEAY